MIVAFSISSNIFIAKKDRSQFFWGFINNHLYDSKLMNPRIDEKEPEKTEVINYATDIEHRIPGWLKEPNGSSRLTTLNKNLND
ncbi:hypothetical protein ACUOFC_49920, partial [Escherichia sp. TWPC-MK]